MAITYTWTVAQMDAHPEYGGQTDVVFTVHWRLNGVDGEYTAGVYGSVGLTLDPGAPFTPYANLTLDQVLGWVWANGVDKNAQEASVAQQIEDEINPPIVSPPLPWA